MSLMEGNAMSGFLLSILIPLTLYLLATLLSLLKIPAWALSAIRFPLQNFRLPQLIEYTIILLFVRACTDTEQTHPPHQMLLVLVDESLALDHAHIVLNCAMLISLMFRS